MASYSFAELFYDLERNFEITILAVFLLIFIIVFAVLQKTNILGEGKRNFNVVVAGIIGFLTVIPSLTGRGPDVVSPLRNVLPQVGAITVAVILALLLIGLLGGEAKWMGGSLSGIIALAAFGIIIYLFGAELEWWRKWHVDWWGSETNSVIIIILVFAIIIWYITKEPSTGDRAGVAVNALDKIGDMFKK